MIPTVIRIIYILSTDANVVSCLSPLLKKPSLDLNNLRNYPPTSKPFFVRNTGKDCVALTPESFVQPVY